MDAPLRALRSPSSTVRIVLDGQEVQHLTEVNEAANTVYIERTFRSP